MVRFPLNCSASSSLYKDGFLVRFFGSPSFKHCHAFDFRADEKLKKAFFLELETGRSSSGE